MPYHRKLMYYLCVTFHNSENNKSPQTLNLWAFRSEEGT